MQIEINGEIIDFLLLSPEKQVKAFEYYINEVEKAAKECGYEMIYISGKGFKFIKNET